MLYKTEKEKQERVDFLKRHGFLYSYSLNDGTEVFLNDDRYKINLKMIR